MAIIWDYRCSKCHHEWSLFSKRFELGPKQWGAMRYTCFNCQTFLLISQQIDRLAWKVWREGNAALIAKVPELVKLSAKVDELLNAKPGLAPVPLLFESVECPTCHEEMSTTPFGSQKMKCPQCDELSGNLPDDGVIWFG